MRVLDLASNVMLIVLESWALFNSHKIVGFKTTSHSTLAKMNDSENWVLPFWVFFFSLLSQSTVLSGVNTMWDLIPALWQVTVYLKGQMS